MKAVRRFNRFITRRIGVLDPYLGSKLSLTDVRVLYELAHREAPVASELARELGLDGGYMSRILRRFEQYGWIERHSSTKDARQILVMLTAAGREVFEPLQQRSRDGAAALLAPLLERQLFGIRPYDPVTFAAVPAMLLLVAAAAAFAPARRAMRIEPTHAMREH